MKISFRDFQGFSGIERSGRAWEVLRGFGNAWEVLGALGTLWEALEELDEPGRL